MRPALYARETASAVEETHALAVPFNEARALCAGNFDDSSSTSAPNAPSMRPALYARETWPYRRRIPFRTGPFNEARALCAGNWRCGPDGAISTRAFNEARALCAGNCQTVTQRIEDTDPSMRPALYARETNLARFL